MKLLVFFGGWNLWFPPEGVLAAAFFPRGFTASRLEGQKSGGARALEPGRPAARARPLAYINNSGGVLINVLKGAKC
ncbi:MAG TPA: hypothetical protein VMW93_03295, partial [bacterium]|nr:hypothetical protein [bacterium]